MHKKLISWYKRERIFLFSALILGIVFTMCFAIYTKAYSEKMQSGIASEVIRLHVKANSDLPEDQMLKLDVKNRVLEGLRSGLSDSKSKDETRAFLQNNLKYIERIAGMVIDEHGKDYAVTATITEDYFPTKSYGDVTLPAGSYEALRIDIGESSGANWWCVMFPPLCYVDVTKKELPDSEKDKLKYLLTSSQYELITKHEEPAKELDVQIKFKIVEWWQERKEKKEGTVIAGKTF